MSDEHNAARKRRYNSDPEYRERQKQARRESYARNHQQRRKDASEMLAVIDDYGMIRTHSEGIGITFTNDELAHILCYHPVRLRGWQKEGRFPRPSHKVAHAHFSVFTLSEAKQLATIMARHQETNQYLRAEHTETIQALLAVV